MLGLHAIRVEVSEKQLRDDLLSMLVAGHETTGSALTWTLHLLAANPETLAKVRFFSWPRIAYTATQVCVEIDLVMFYRLFLGILESQPAADTKGYCPSVLTTMRP